jgi:hypothetical protein
MGRAGYAQNGEVWTVPTMEMLTTTLKAVNLDKPIQSRVFAGAREREEAPAICPPPLEASATTRRKPR